MEDTHHHHQRVPSEFLEPAQAPCIHCGNELMIDTRTKKVVPCNCLILNGNTKGDAAT